MTPPVVGRGLRPRRPMKDSGLKWVGQIPAGWEVSRLQWHLDEVNNGNDPVRSSFILSLTNDRGVIPYSEKGNSGNKSKEDLSGYKLAYRNCIVANSMNVIIGSVGLSKYDGCVSPVYYVFRPLQGECVEFINYIFQTQPFQRELRKFAKGILEIRLRISSSAILKREIPFPPLPEQRAIAARLDELTGRIDSESKKMAAEIERLEQYKKSFITEAVCGRVNFNTEAQRHGEGATSTKLPRPMKDSGIPWVGQIPEEWQAVRAGWVMYEVNNRSIDGNEEPLSMSQKLGIVRSRDIQVGNPASSFVGAKIVEPGDLVLNKLKAHLGVFAVSKYRGLVSPDYAVYRAKSETSTEYLNYIFHSSNCISEFKRHITGVVVGFNRLYTSELFTIKLPLPPLPEQHAIAAAIDATCAKVDAIVTKRKRQLDRLDALKRSLVYEYVTGKKEVA